VIQVLDASVLVKWFVEDEGREPAIGLLDEVVNQPRRFALPGLAWYELSHVLLRVTRKVEPAFQNLERVMLLGIPCFAATPERCIKAMQMAKRFNLSGYDAHYVVLAEELEGRWVTFDAKAARSVTPRSRVRCLA
jgi:predicted nucleic acid-binding protein